MQRFHFHAFQLGTGRVHGHQGCLALAGRAVERHHRDVRDELSFGLGRVCGRRRRPRLLGGGRAPWCDGSSDHHNDGGDQYQGAGQQHGRFTCRPPTPYGVNPMHRPIAQEKSLRTTRR
jgi:hypothetical protein